MSASSKKKLRKEQEIAALTEKQQHEQKEAKKLKVYSVTFVVAIALILAIGLGLLVNGWINNSGILQRNSVALTIGDHEISAAELNYYYIDSINAQYNNWYNSYGQYMSAYMGMMGLDIYSPLDQQMYNAETSMTWADYFLELAVNEAVSVYAVYDAAVAAGHQMTEDDTFSVEAAMQSMQTAATNANYPTLEGYLKAFYGNGATEESFRNYLSVVALASSYETKEYNDLTYSDETIQKYSDEHYIDFTSFTYSTFQVNNTAFLEQVCTKAEGETDHKHSKEEEAAALKAAEEAANALLEAAPITHIAFDKAIKNLDAYKDSTTASATENIAQLYTSISNTDIADWLADNERKPGDMTIITNSTTSTNEDGTTTENPYAYTVVLFIERNDNNVKMVNIRHILRAFSDDANATEFTDAQKAAALDAIETLQEDWLANGGTEEAFIARVSENTADAGSVSNGGLYSDVYPGQMVPAFNNWCFAEGRKTGDYGIVESEYGYHLIYFVGEADTTFRGFMVENTLRNNDFDTWYTEISESVEAKELNTKYLSLDMVLSGN